MILSICSLIPLKSGINVSNVVSGVNALIALMVFDQIIDPPSGSSSLSTLVKTACFTFIKKIASATL